jgi:hypothetical protein
VFAAGAATCALGAADGAAAWANVAGGATASMIPASKAIDKEAARAIHVTFLGHFQRLRILSFTVPQFNCSFLIVVSWAALELPRLLLNWPVLLKTRFERCQFVFLFSLARLRRYGRVKEHLHRLVLLRRRRRHQGRSMRTQTCFDCRWPRPAASAQHQPTAESPSPCQDCQQSRQS